MADEIIKVLLVEDNPGDAFLIQELIKEVNTANLELYPVERLSEALKILASDTSDGSVPRFDVMLLDLSLPDSQGIDTFVRANRETNVLPIIVLTGIDDENLALKAMQKGAQDYLVKGQVTGDLLVRSIRYAIERQRVEEALRHSEERFRVALKNSPIFVFNQDRDLRGFITQLLGGQLKKCWVNKTRKLCLSRMPNVSLPSNIMSSLQV